MYINKELRNALYNYSPKAQVKILVDGKEQDIRCLIFDKETNTLILADSCYEC